MKISTSTVRRDFSIASTRLGLNGNKGAVLSMVIALKYYLDREGIVPADTLDLSKQETKVLSFVALGLSPREIAEQISTLTHKISFNTVRAYERIINLKLKAKNRFNAIAIGLVSGRIDVSYEQGQFCGIIKSQEESKQ